MVVLDEVRVLVEGGSGSGDLGEVDVLLPVVPGLDRAIRPAAGRVVVVIQVHQFGHDRIVAPARVGTGAMLLVRRVVAVEAVVRIGRAVLVGLAEDELAVLALQEQGRQVVFRLADRRGGAAVQGELAGVDDLLAGLDALGKVRVRIGSLHVGELLLNGLVAGGNRLLGPVLAQGRRIQRHAGLQAEGRPLAGAIFTALRLVRKKFRGLVQLGDHEIPGLLLRAARNVEAFILVTIVLVVQRLGHDRNATVTTHHCEIAVGPGKDGLAQHLVTGFLVDGVLLQGQVDLLDELVDRTHLRIIPETRHGDVVVVCLRVGGKRRVLVLPKGAVPDPPVSKSYHPRSSG